MNKNSNTYTIVYAAVMVIVVAVLLAIAATALKEPQQANIRGEKMGAILKTIGQGQDAETASNKNAYIAQEFDKYIVSAITVNADGNFSETTKDDAIKSLEDLPELYASQSNMPLFIADIDGVKSYVVPITGTGLWGKIWGYIALEDDYNTIRGIVFDHESETPGLGAEIATAKFQAQFNGKKIKTDDGSIFFTLTKGVGSSKDNPNAVDAVSGGTLTSNGVRNMMNGCLKAYANYFNKQLSE